MSSCTLNWHLPRKFCMKDWLDQNLNGSKDTFEHYFKALPADITKVSSYCFTLIHRLTSTPFHSRYTRTVLLLLYISQCHLLRHTRILTEDINRKQHKWERRSVSTVLVFTLPSSRNLTLSPRARHKSIRSAMKTQVYRTRPRQEWGWDRNTAEGNCLQYYLYSSLGIIFYTKLSIQ